MAMSPDDYIRGAGGRRSMAQPHASMPVTYGGQGGGFFGLDDPRLIDYLRDGRATASGRFVTESSALRNATFYRAINLICSSIGMLPLNLLKITKDGAEKDTTHPVHKVLRYKPNDFQTPLQFKAFMQGRALLEGNAYAYKVMSGTRLVSLIPMDPCRVTVKLGDDWRLKYEWQRPGKQKLTLDQREVMHLRAPFSRDGITGQSLLKVASEALGLAETADEAAARLLNNGAYVGGVLKHPKSLSKEAVERLAAQFAERHGGPENAGKWLVTEEGLEAMPFGMTGQAAQGLEQRSYQAEEVSRFTGVPRPLLMFDETSWGSGIEQLGLFLITYCLLPWFKAWEEVAEQALLTEAERLTHQIKFNEGALLRGSLKDQAEWLNKALGAGGSPGFVSQNEAREKFDMNRKDDADGLNPGSGAVKGTPNASA